MRRLGLDSALTPTKGHHFGDGTSYVQYKGTLENAASHADAIEAEFAKLVAEELERSVELLSPSECEARSLHAVGDVTRVVSFDRTLPCPCGGTHVANSREVGQVRVRKVSSKKGKTTVAYDLVD